ncbi:hypothetical protein NSA23_16445 [Anaerosalibacter massiliensis]|uniref:DUF5626 domain-containing protein n=1 Tax=Anaerosalibacter massiliensis TaxID=1347392 RepID=A0A9X2S6I1_9FIRM|nr:hypothetical protein [Anaerosalibacter massiliensis]MCR2045673.1 hypothetical protein [Anaerosalibacter massiliensis]
MKKTVRFFSFILSIVFVFSFITTVNAESAKDDYVDVNLELNDKGDYEGEIELYIDDSINNSGERFGKEIRTVANGASVGSVKFYMSKVKSGKYALSMHFKLSGRYQADMFSGVIQVRDGVINRDILYNKAHTKHFGMSNSRNIKIGTISLPNRKHYQVRLKSGGFRVHTGEYAIAHNNWYNVWPR